MTSQKPKILLVDDESRFVDSLESILTYYNYNCTKAINGAEAIAKLKQDTFQLALLDVALPDMSGCDIARYLKVHCPATTVLMLTGINTVETAVQAMKLGAYDFLRKPLNHELLLRALEKALQHNRLEHRLRLSEERFKILAEATWEAIIIHENGRIVEANEQFCAMFGYNRDDIGKGLKIRDCLTLECLSEDLDTLDLDEGGRCMTTGLRKDGSQLPIEAKSRTITFSHQSHRVWVIRDRSEEVQAGMEKLSLQKKLASASKLNALGLMAGSVAHDLNNILSGIVSYPDLLLLQMSETDKHYGHIQKIKEAGKRAAAVVSDLVAITRGGNQPKVVANINEIVFSYLNSIEHGERLADYPDVILETYTQKDIRNSCCSPQHLHKVLLNLVGNALEAVEGAGVIRITTENCKFSNPLRGDMLPPDEDNFVRLTISDNGPGISQEEIDHIFDPFYTTKVMGKSGTGLGLSIVWKIVQDHGGWVEVTENKPGAVFEVYLPATNDTMCPVSSFSVKELQQGSGEKILIVDDEAEQNEILENALMKMGYSAFSVTSGEAGIDFLKNTSVDVILLDMMMGSGLNGRETLEIIKTIHPNPKAIVISGYAKRDEIEKTRALGVNLFLEKPVTLSKLSVAIKNTLDGN